VNHYPTRNTRPIVRPGLLILLVLLAASGVGCGSGGCGGGRTVAEERAYRAARATGPILIGVAADPEGSMWRGIRMAVEETNAAGGVLGRELRVVQRYDESSVAKAKLVAQQFARNLDIVAVIGHWGSDMAISASATYEFAGLLMICPAATSPKLTEQGFHLVFRTSPSNRRVGPRLAEFAADQGYQRVMIVSARDAYGRGLGNVFEMRAAEAGITVVDRASYQDGERNFEPLLADWGRLDFDAVFVAGTMPEAAHVVAQARRVGVSRPVLGGEGLATDALWEIAGEAAEGAMAAAYFHPAEPRPEVQRFTDDFRARYGAPPDVWAAQGYDAVRLLAHAMETAGTTVPEDVAAALRSMGPASAASWTGVTGPHAFLKDGDVVGKPIVLTIMRDGRLAYHSTLRPEEER